MSAPLAPRNQRFVHYLVLLILFLVMSSSCGASNAAPQILAKHAALSPSSTPTQCASQHSAADFVLLFSHRAAGQDDGVRCVDQGPLDQNQENTEQSVTPAVSGVYKICTHRFPAAIVYSSYDDPATRPLVLAADAFGSVYLFLEPGTCELVDTILLVPHMTVTSVWIDSFTERRTSDSPTPTPLIHQVESWKCAYRSDFFTVWYNGGRSVACFANAGYLELSHPLTGVVKVCDGSNTGDAVFGAEQDPGISSIRLSLDQMHTCVTPELVREDTMIVNAIFIDGQN